ncbi:MAG: DUF302 domain-containing protein [Bacteroidota bacterium]
MKKNLLTGILGFVLGLVLAFFILYKAAPGMMLLEDESKYATFEETVTKFEQSVKDHNWKIPTIHDLQNTMAKFGKDVKAVKVFELCHPDHAGKILEKSDERVVSSLMPCRVAIYEKEDGKVYISRMNSGLMASTMNGVIPEVMKEASKQNEEILEAILKD